MNPNVRYVTDLTTIPASVAQSGTLTPVVGNELLLEYSGTAAALDAILVQAGANKQQQKINLWVWDGTDTEPFNIRAWFGKFIKVDRDASAYNGDFNLIESKLFGYEVVDPSSGVNLPFKPQTYSFIDPKVIDKTDNELVVIEFYNLQS
jgi:hypothetical protein